jgi:N-acetylglutamate synthase-like GNAT family acetyltransferase
MQEINFYIAGEPDIPRIHQLVNSAYRGETSKTGWTTEADFLDGIRVDPEGLREMIQTKDAIILQAKIDEKLVGCVYLEQQGNKLYLGMLTVDPTLQAKGLGKKILKESERRALEKNCSSIMMTVITLRKELIEWYERHGYHATGEKRPFPEDPRFGIPKQRLEFMVMKKDLDHNNS